MVKKRENKAIIVLGVSGSVSGQVGGVVVQKNNVIRAKRLVSRRKKKQNT